MLSIVKIVFICYYVLTVIVSSEKCPTVPTKSNFTAAQYMGKWYELERYPYIFETDLKCVTDEYTLNSNGTVTVNDTGITSIGDFKSSIIGLATPNPTNPSNLSVSYFRILPPGYYWVLDTDYTTYSLVYSCVDLPFSLRVENAWILARDKNISAFSTTTLSNLKQTLSSYNSSTNRFTQTTQNCNN